MVGTVIPGGSSWSSGRPSASATRATTTGMHASASSRRPTRLDRDEARVDLAVELQRPQCKIRCLHPDDPALEMADHPIVLGKQRLPALDKHRVALRLQKKSKQLLTADAPLLQQLSQVNG